MPLKRKLPGNSPAVTAAPRAAPKPTAKAPAPAKKKVARKIGSAPRPAAAPVAQNAQLGPAMDPATLPGANDSAPSIADQLWDIRFRVSGSGNPTAQKWLFQAQRKEHKTGSDWIWRQCGQAIVIERFDLYVRYTGRLSGNTVSGEAKNITGANWTWDGELSASQKSSPSLTFSCDSM